MYSWYCWWQIRGWCNLLIMIHWLREERGRLNIWWHYLRTRSRCWILSVVEGLLINWRLLGLRIVVEISLVTRGHAISRARATVLFSLRCSGFEPPTTTWWAGPCITPLNLAGCWRAVKNSCFVNTGGVLNLIVILLNYLGRTRSLIILFSFAFFFHIWLKVLWVLRCPNI